MEIESKYVTFEQAKWLKEKGFDVPTEEYFDLNNIFTNSKQSISMVYKQNWNEKYSDKQCTKKELISRPEQHEVFEWLRVNHGIWVYISCYTKILGDKIPLYQYEIRLYGEQFVEDCSSFNSPQEAYSAAFDYLKDNRIF